MTSSLRRWGRQRLTDVQRREIDRLKGALRERGYWCSYGSWRSPTSSAVGRFEPQLAKAAEDPD